MEPLLILDWQLWSAPLLFVLGGLVAGILIERTVVVAAERMLEHATDNPDVTENVPSYFQGAVFWLIFLAGVYLATYSLPYVGQMPLVAVRKLIVIIGMVMAFKLVGNIAVVFIRNSIGRGTGQRGLPHTSILENVTRVIVYIVGILVVLQTLDISVIPIITALGVGGLAISLALQDTLANIFAGINMLMARQVKVGDYVRLEAGQEGVVEDIGWRTTVIRQLSNNIVIVPNSKLASSIITTSCAPHADSPEPEMSLNITVGVAYSADLERVEAVALDVARQVLREVEGAVKHWEPTVRFTDFGASAIDFTVGLRVHSPTDQYLLRHKFIQRLHARFREEGLEIPFPQQTLHFDPQELAAVIQGPTAAAAKKKNTATAAKKPSQGDES